MTPPTEIRWQQRLASFERALSLLREAMLNGPGALNQLEKEGVIHRFEYCFELGWKTKTSKYFYQSGRISITDVFWILCSFECTDF